MNPDTIYKGLVTYYSVERHFGFIDSDIEEDIFFFFDKDLIRKMNPDDRKQQRKTFFKGDEVCFKVRPATKGRSGIEAYDLRFIRNVKIEELFDLHKEQKPQIGFIKKIDDGYFVKDKKTYLFIPIEISGWEIGLDEVYESRINEPVSYIVEKIPKDPKHLKALLTDRILSKLYYQLVELKKSGKLVTVRITGIKNNGCFGTFLNNAVDCFILLNKQQAETTHLKKGDIAACRIKYLNPGSVMMELAEDIG